MDGGFVLRDGRVEVNCTFDALIRLQRNELARPGGQSAVSRMTGCGNHTEGRAQRAGRREKDVDYLALSARVRAMENRLLTQERLDRMIDARDPAEAAKVLAECGYGELAELTGDGLEELLNQAQDQLARDLSSYPQAAAILPVFQCATDYHNAKVLVKGEALGWDGERMGRLLMPGGRWSSEKLLDGYQKSGLEGCTETFRLAVNRAREVLAASRRPSAGGFCAGPGLL